MTDNSTLRLRIFAGPNGSGKSTIINAIKQKQINDIPIDFGIYVNADDIARDLKSKRFNFHQYQLGKVTHDRFTGIAIESGLINQKFPERLFLKSFKFINNNLTSTNAEYIEHLAQVIADYLRKELLLSSRKIVRK